MESTTTSETQLARARHAVAAAEREVREERAQLAALHTRDRPLSEEVKRIHAVIRAVEDRAGILEAQARLADVEQRRADLAKEIAGQELVVEKREAKVVAARQALEDVGTRAAVIRARMAREEADVRQLERDIARAEADLESWRAGLAGLLGRVEQARRELEGIGA